MIDVRAFGLVVVVVAIHAAIVVGAEPAIDDADPMALTDRELEYATLLADHSPCMSPHYGVRRNRGASPTTVTSAVAEAENDVEGCFMEWNELHAGDVDMTVRLGVTPDGRGHSSVRPTARTRRSCGCASPRRSSACRTRPGPRCSSSR